MMYELQMHTHTSMHMCAVYASDTYTYEIAGSLMTAIRGLGPLGMVGDQGTDLE